MVKSLKNNKGQMLPLIGFIILLMGASFGSIYAVKDLNNDIQARAKFQNYAIELFTTLEEMELFYEEMIELAFKEMLYFSPVDTFEGQSDGDVPDGWVITVDQDGYFEIDTAHSFDGSASVKARGESEMSPQAVWTEGHKDITPASPESIVFSKRIGDEIRPSFTDLHRVRFQSDSTSLFTFDFLTEGGNPYEMVTITSGCDDMTDAFPTQTWITVNLKNIDWSAGTYDFTATDGSQIYERTGCSFENSGSSVNQIFTRDKAYNAEPSWTDGIMFKTSEKQCPAKIKTAEESMEFLISSNIDDWADHYGTYEEHPIPKLNLGADEPGEFDLTVSEYFDFVKSSTIVENNKIEVYFDEDENDYFVHTADLELEVTGTEGEAGAFIFRGIDSDGHLACSHSESTTITNSIPISVSFNCDQMIQRISAEITSGSADLEELTVSTDLYGMGYSEIKGHASEPLKVASRGIEVSASSAFKERIPAEIDVKPDYVTEYLKVFDSDGNEIDTCDIDDCTVTIESRFSNDGCAESETDYYIKAVHSDGSEYLISDGTGPALQKSITAEEIWTPTEAGIYEIVSKIDPDNEIDEEDETNNEIIKSFEVTMDCSPEIYTWYDLDAVRNCPSLDFTLMNDLDDTTDGYDELASSAANDTAGWSPINDFEGTFDGQGNTISGLYIDRPDTVYVGLFGYAEDAVIENVGVVNADITGNNNVGGLIGYNNIGSVSDSYATGSVSGIYGDHIGGLIGYNNIGSVSDSYATGSVVGRDYVGGLIGVNNNDGSVSDSYATGSVDGSGAAAGGLVGYNWEGSVSDSYATGSVVGGDYVGGLIGFNDDFGSGGSVSNSYSTGDVTGIDQYDGGLIGYNDNDDSSVSDSFWDTETSGQSSSDGGTGKTTAEMQTLDTFTDISTDGLSSPWDFIGNPNDDTADEDIWYLPDSDYPRFTWVFADSVCGPGNCGNEIVEEGEECDTGGVDTAMCVGVTCCLSYCGDGYLNTKAGEECDTGGVDTEECNGGVCQYSACGDGYLNTEAGEECDTGGVDTEECNAATCQFW